MKRANFSLIALFLAECFSINCLVNHNSGWQLDLPSFPHFMLFCIEFNSYGSPSICYSDVTGLIFFGLGIFSLRDKIVEKLGKMGFLAKFKVFFLIPFIAATISIACGRGDFSPLFIIYFSFLGIKMVLGPRPSAFRG